MGILMPTSSSIVRSSPDNNARGYNLVAVANTFVFPMAGYSDKIKNISELKTGDTIVPCRMTRQTSAVHYY